MTNTTEKLAFSVDDLSKLRYAGGASLSPDEGFAVYVVTEIVNDDRKDFIILHTILTGEQTVIAQGHSPAWCPVDLIIAYIADHEGSAAIITYDVKQKKTEFIARVYESLYFIDHYALNNFSWSPDGKQIAFVSTWPSDYEKITRPVRVFTDLLYKTKGGRGRSRYAEELRQQIWTVALDTKEARPVFVNAYRAHSIAWSPDSSRICFISNTSGMEDRKQWSDVFTTDLLTGTINRVSREKGAAFQPAWSPDGKYIAYLGIENEISTNDSPAEDTQVYLIPSAGGPATCLTLALDRRAEQICWDPLSGSVYFTAGDAGSTLLYRVSTESKEMETVFNRQGKVLEYSLSPHGNRIIYTFSDTVNPSDVFIYDIGKHSTVAITHLNEAFLKTHLFYPADTFWFPGFDNTPIQGWLIKPGLHSGQEKYPLILVIHGGPHNMFGYEFEDRMQLLVANGYGVLFVNPRGSSGYGQAFSNGTVRAWGEGDYEDLMKGVDYVLETAGWVDPNRLGVTGQSYGGYMTNRIITKTSRFKAAVADGSISNLVSFAGTSLYHSLLESEFQGSPYDHYDLLWNCSPLKDIKKVTTPVLFFHGETDQEVPFSQAEEMYMGVKKMGVETVLIQYTAEGHGWRPDLLPENKKDLLQRMLDWFNTFI